MEYSLIFSKDTSYKIVRPTGEFAHENFEESRYAIDFLVALNTPVLATRKGIVVKIKSDSEKYGLDKNLASEANYVVVEHDDKTFAEYLHLGKDKVVVKQGQKVGVGDILGYTGLSGCMSEPHLNLNVFKVQDGKGVSIPFEFKA